MVTQYTEELKNDAKGAEVEDWEVVRTVRNVGGVAVAMPYCFCGKLEMKVV